MSTHINAQPGQIAETVLLPGDPLRAKFIAENFLTDVVCYNEVRNMFGYTGLYKGERISTQGSGMGLPSLMIYAHELLADYNVQNLIRVGTTGGLKEDVNIRDIILVQGATTDNALFQNIFDQQVNFSAISDFNLLYTAYEKAKEMQLPVKVGNILSSDRFYNQELDIKKLADYGVLAVEMESAGLFALTAQHQRRGLTILTVSDHLFTGESTSSEEREQSFTEMMHLALETAISLH